MSGSSLSLPQQKYIRTREFGHFLKRQCLFVMCSRHHLGPLHWDSNIKAQQHICLTALNTTKTSSVSSNCDPAYSSYYFHHTEPLWKVLEILWHREHTVHNIKLCKLLKISNCFAKQKTTYNHNYITLKWKHCHLNSIVVTSCNTLGTCKPASTHTLAWRPNIKKTWRAGTWTWRPQVYESQVYLDLNKVA